MVCLQLEVCQAARQIVAPIDSRLGQHISASTLKVQPAAIKCVGVGIAANCALCELR